MVPNISTLTKSEIISGILIIISFILAIAIANSRPYSQVYLNFVFLPISFGHGQFALKTTLINVVNDGLMTLFFLLIGLELKFHLVRGEYQDRKALILPTAAAIGGVLVPALIYLYFNFNQPTSKGWAIPIATDTAFMLGILSFFSKRIPKNLRAFIISFSLIDDALALVILAIFYTKSLNISALAISFVLFILLLLLNRNNVKSSFYYLGAGIFLWIAMVEAGIHGTLCGAVLALTIPVEHNKHINPSFQGLESILRPIVYFFIIPLFIFINSGITLNNLSQEMLLSDISIGIILGLFIGKQCGIAGVSYIALKLGLCDLPHNVRWAKFYAISILGGIGFTLSLFIGDLTFEIGEPHYTMRASIIIASLLSAFAGASLLAYISKRHTVQV